MTWEVLSLSHWCGPWHDWQSDPATAPPVNNTSCHLIITHDLGGIDLTVTYVVLDKVDNLTSNSPSCKQHIMSPHHHTWPGRHWSDKSHRCGPWHDRQSDPATVLSINNTLCHHHTRPWKCWSGYHWCGLWLTICSGNSPSCKPQAFISVGLLELLIVALFFLVSMCVQLTNWVTHHWLAQLMVVTAETIAVALSLQLL